MYNCLIEEIKTGEIKNLKIRFISYNKAHSMLHFIYMSIRCNCTTRIAEITSRTDCFISPTELVAMTTGYKLDWREKDV